TRAGAARHRGRGPRDGVRARMRRRAGPGAAGRDRRGAAGPGPGGRGRPGRDPAGRRGRGAPAGGAARGGGEPTSAARAGGGGGGGGGGWVGAGWAGGGRGDRAGLVALPLLSSFDYLLLRADETARRLVRPQVRRFVEEDAARGGALIATLTEYAACDLNARTAARPPHLHVNTAYYRLERIAERTGCDLRSVTDVLELLIAVRLHGPPPG